MLGKVENHRRIAALSDIGRLSAFSKGLVPYLYKKLPDDTPLYPTHRTADQKRVLRNKRATAARRARKSA